MPSLQPSTDARKGQRRMKAYGRNLRWIGDHQYGDEMHTGIAMPASGKRRGQRRRRCKRPFKKSERQHSKHMIRKSLAGISPP